MMYRGDRVPSLPGDCSYPEGFCIDEEAESRADEWFVKMEATKDAHFHRYVEQTYAVQPRIVAGNSRAKTHNAAKTLCWSWDRTVNTQEKKKFFNYATKGYMMTMSFDNDAGYLPRHSVDLSEDLWQMQEENNLHRMREFGHRVWQTIERYPHINRNYDRLFELAKKQYQIGPDENREYFRAGMAVPFAISWVSAVIASTHNFSSLSPLNANGQKRNIGNSSDFGALFTTEARLVKDNVVPENYLKEK